MPGAVTVQASFLNPAPWGAHRLVALHTLPLPQCSQLTAVPKTRLARRRPCQMVTVTALGTFPEELRKR